MAVLWDPYADDHIDDILSDNHDHHGDSSCDRDAARPTSDKSNNNLSLVGCSDGNFIVPDKWEYLYDIEIWHKNAVLDKQ